MSVQAKELAHTIIQFLQSHGAIMELPDVLTELNAYYDAHIRRNNVAVVKTTQQLSAEEETAIRQELPEIFGRELDVEVVLDESLLGGFTIQVGDIVIDRSLKSKLAEVKRVLLH